MTCFCMCKNTCLKPKPNALCCNLNIYLCKIKMNVAYFAALQSKLETRTKLNPRLTTWLITSLHLVPVALPPLYHRYTTLFLCVHRSCKKKHRFRLSISMHIISFFVTVMLTLSSMVISRNSLACNYLSCSSSS